MAPAPASPPTAEDLQAKTERIARRARAAEGARSIIGTDVTVRPLTGVELVLVGRGRTIGVFPTYDEALREAMAHTPATLEQVAHGHLVVELLGGGTR